MEQVKSTLFDLCGTSDSKIIGIRPGEKLHETLINFDEMRSVWIYNDLYVILNEGFSSEYLQNTYPGLTKLENISTYSSDNSEKMSNDELKQTILDSNLIKK